MIFFYSIFFIVLIWLIISRLGSFILKKRQKILIEDILKQLYNLENNKCTTTVRSLSEGLQVGKKNILSATTEMEALKLIQPMDKHILSLTDLGKIYALKIIRIHRLFEKYLAEKTGFQQADWHHLAEKMEHKLSEKETNTLNTKLGNPMFDPHGDPIPSEHGALISTKSVALTTFSENTPCKIMHIEDEPKVVYKQILEKKIFRGAHLIVKKSTSHKIIIISEGYEHSLSPIIAANISVKPLSSDEVYEKDVSRLTTLEIGEIAKVVRISKDCLGANRRRLLDLGILSGTPIAVDLKSPMLDPIAYKIRDTSIALRNSLAELILITKTPPYHEK